MKKLKFLSYKNLTTINYLTFLILLIFPGAYYIMAKYENNFFVSSLILFWIIIILLISKQYKKLNGKKIYNTSYYVLVCTLIGAHILFQTAILLNFYIEISINIFSLIILISLFMYFIAIIIVINMVLTFLYYFILGHLFPKEADSNRSYPRIKKLSKYIELSDQKLYFNLASINIILIMAVILAMYFWLIKVISLKLNVSYQDSPVLNFILSNINFGILFGLISFCITFYAFSNPFLQKIYSEAYEELKKDFNMHE